MSDDTRPETVRAALELLGRHLVDRAPLDVTLHRVTQLAVSAFPAASYAALTMMVEGRPETAVYTDEEAPAVDAAQYEADEGPCLDAYRGGVINRIDDTTTEARWPAFSAVAAAHGIRSTLSLPLIAGGESRGALNLYSGTVDGFAHADEDTGMALATHAAAGLANSLVYWTPGS